MDPAIEYRPAPRAWRARNASKWMSSAARVTVEAEEQHHRHTERRRDLEDGQPEIQQGAPKPGATLVAPSSISRSASMAHDPVRGAARTFTADAPRPPAGMIPGDQATVRVPTRHHVRVRLVHDNVRRQRADDHPAKAPNQLEAAKVRTRHSILAVAKRCVERVATMDGDLERATSPRRPLRCDQHQHEHMIMPKDVAPTGPSPKAGVRNAPRSSTQTSRTPRSGALSDQRRGPRRRPMLLVIDAMAEGARRATSRCSAARG